MSTQKNKKKIFGSLLFWVIVAIIAGGLIGQIPNLPSGTVVPFATFNDIFGKFLGFCVPLIIVGLIGPALADLGRGAGKWLLITVGIAYASTLFAGFGTFAVSKAVFPWLLKGDVAPELKEPANAVSSLLVDAKGESMLSITPIFDVTTALVLAFVLGIAMAALGTPTLHKAFNELRDITMLLIKKAIVPVLPLYIFGTFLNMSYSGEIVLVIRLMIKVIILSVILTVVLLLIQYLVAGAIAGVNPFKALANMAQAYFTALGTSSSAATIPVTYQCALKNGISRDIAGFTIPLCATIHLGGSTTKITAFALATMQMTDMEVSFGKFAVCIFILGVSMVAAPGVPGGAIAAAQGVLIGFLGFTDPMYSLMVALYVAIDSIGTATNVTGDGAIALIVNRFARGTLGAERGQSMATAKVMVSASD